MNRRPKIGLALGSGGARGWCHIGVLKALDEIGITPDVVAGTSMGAIVGAAWAGRRLEALEDWVRALTPGRFVSMMDLRLRSGGLVEAREIETVLKELGVPDRIEDMAHPFAAIATDMETGREIWIDHGPTYKAVRASAGIPGVMCPINIDDRWLLDGGLVNPVPVSAARALGAEVIVAVNPNGKPRGRIWLPPKPKPGGTWVASVLPDALHEALGIDPEASAKAITPNYFDVLSAAIDVMTETIRRARFAGEPPHVQLNGEFTALTMLELHRGREAIARGEEMVREKADELRAVCLGEWA
ncbi:patatin-like phospholipase family protein [Maritimibacter sp. HL-12]|jgi:NTE family protein|uniref:patatin-like phospholipase family protein n=1 Tax=Maritimibacter sp. HL-12 TaxID=1162418 RepID=UPI000A0F3641|nr:patatin-like phospholipase family protein [Maritimibacter sp. HL-12]SMH56091.1 NTE family protein [Maritimibacter sp. HL-12]